MPAAVVPVAVFAAVLAIPATADASPDLPDKSASDILAMVADSADVSFSGTVEQSSDLGLPPLPSTSGSGMSGALELLTADHSARVFVDGADRSRLQILDQLSERDVVVDGSEVWTYDSSAKTATHVTVDADVVARAEARKQAQSGASTSTPASLASTLIDEISPTTDISVTDTATVAGRDAYELRFTPSTGDSLIGSVTMWIDSDNGLPLGVEVNAQGQSSPAFTTVFSSIEFDAQDPALFSFTPPPGTTVTEKPITAADLASAQAEGEARDGDASPSASGAAAASVSGEGWSRILELPAATIGDTVASADKRSVEDASGTSPSELLEKATSAVDGGRVLQTSLVSILITDDGRILVGAVSADRLQAAAGL